MGVIRADKLCAFRLRSDEVAWIVVQWSSCHGAKENASLFVSPVYPSHLRIKKSFRFICCCGGVFDQTNLIDVFFFKCTKNQFVVVVVDFSAVDDFWDVVGSIFKVSLLEIT